MQFKITCGQCCLRCIVVGRHILALNEFKSKLRTKTPIKNQCNQRHFFGYKTLRFWKHFVFTEWKCSHSCRLISHLRERAAIRVHFCAVFGVKAKITLWGQSTKIYVWIYIKSVIISRCFVVLCEFRTRLYIALIWCSLSWCIWTRKWWKSAKIDTIHSLEKRKGVLWLFYTQIVTKNWANWFSFISWWVMWLHNEWLNRVQLSYDIGINFKNVITMSF